MDVVRQRREVWYNECAGRLFDGLVGSVFTGEGIEMDRFYWVYNTPKGFSDLIMFSDGEFLTGLAFMNETGKSENRWKKSKQCELKFYNPVFSETVRWLDLYFGRDNSTGEFCKAGCDPGFTPPLKISALTPFRRSVLDAVRVIPYGKTVTYGEIAQGIAKERGLEKMSARAVGGAVGWNPIVLIIPCHRVVGADGKLTGYGGGMKNKIALLKTEGTLK